MAETQNEESTTVLDFDSRITKLQTSFQESNIKMMKLIQKSKEEQASDKLDKLSSTFTGPLQSHKKIRTWLHGLKAEFEKCYNPKKKNEEFLDELIENFCKQEAEVHESLDVLKNVLDCDDDSSDPFEIGISFEEAERELYKILYGKCKDDLRVDEGLLSGKKVASLFKMELISSLSGSTSYPRSDLSRQGRKEASIKGLKQDFKNLEIRSKARTNLRKKNVQPHRGNR